MWRHDRLRSGATSEQLPDKLQVKWVRELAPIAPAWPEEPRSQFDLVYEPVISGKRLFVASPVDGSIRAWNTDTGNQLWCYYTNGPARFAPAVRGDRVFAVSDDGFLYALDTATGRLIWKVNGAVGRSLRRQLGNNRLVSWWTARGGAVITTDGTVYFAAGIWPTFGVYVNAVNASTGKVIWTNSDVSWLPHVRIDHNDLFTAALSPQGYLLVAGNKLLVPNGRSMPAGFDRKTGKLLYYLQGYRHGDCRVVASKQFAFVGHSAVVNIGTGREVGSKWKAAGSKAPNRFDPKKMDLFEGPYFQYKFMPGCNAWSVVTSTRIYGLEKGVFYCYDLTQPKLTEYKKAFAGRILNPLRWDLPLLWSCPIPQPKPQSGHAVLLAGNRLYGNTGKILWAVDLPDAKHGKPRIAWSTTLKSEPATLAAADGKLFVGTLNGEIICLGSATKNNGNPPPCFPIKTIALPPPSAAAVARVKEWFAVNKNTSGFAVLLGLKNTPDLIAALLTQSRFRIIAVPPRGTNVKALRDALVSAGVYGNRVEIFTTNNDPISFTLPPFLAKLIVAKSANPKNLLHETRKLFKSLRPYGGTLMLRTSLNTHTALTAMVHSLAKNAKIQRHGHWSLLRCDGMLPGAAMWTHECADAGHTFFSRDKRVRPPLGVLWYGDGEGYGFFKYHDYGAGVKPQVAGGRLIALRQKTPSTLVAVDAYTGMQLWTQHVGRFTRYATFPNAVYVADGDHLLILDAKSGAVKKRVKLNTGEPAASNPIARDIRVHGDTIAISVGFGKIGSVVLQGLWENSLIIALDRKTGRQLWRRKAVNRFNNNAFTMGHGLVFCTDSLSPLKGANKKKNSVSLPTVASTVLALDARTGSVRWKQRFNSPYKRFHGSWMGLRAFDDWLGFSDETNILLAGRSGNIHAYTIATGKEIWNRKDGGANPVVIRSTTCITQIGLILDIRNGNQLLSYKLPMRRHHGCNYAVVGTSLEFVRDAFVSYTDITSPNIERYWLRNIRSGCDASLVAADGLLNVPNMAKGCICNYPVQASFAMTYMPETAKWAHPSSLRKPSKTISPVK